MNKNLEAAKKEIHDPERARKIALIDSEVVKYENAFNQVIEFKKQRNNLFYNVLNVEGPEMEKKLSAIFNADCGQ